MKSELEIRDKLEVLRDEAQRYAHPNETQVANMLHVVSQERVHALEWVLGENDEW